MKPILNIGGMTDEEMKAVILELAPEMKIEDLAEALSEALDIGDREYLADELGGSEEEGE